jgi:hypothetical protein
VVGAVAKG